jgi:hypothetical protein
MHYKTARLCTRTMLIRQSGKSPFRGRTSVLAISPILAVLTVAATQPAHAQFTGQRVTLDRRYPTDSKIPSKYGTQFVAKDGSQLLAGSCSVRITAAQVEVPLSTLYFKYTFADTTCNGYRLTISNPQSASRNPKSHAIPPPVSSVTVDPHTNLPGFDSSRISYSGSYVQVNLAALTLGLSNRLVLDVGFAPPASSARSSHHRRASGL